MSDPAKMIATIKTITIMRVIRTALCIHKLLSWGYLIVYGKTCGKLASTDPWGFKAILCEDPREAEVKLGQKCEVTAQICQGLTSPFFFLVTAL